MKTVLGWILIIVSIGSLYVNCAGEKSDSTKDSVSSLAKGKWKLESSVCGTNTYAYTMIDTVLTLSDGGNYEVADTLSSGCVIKRTGTWSGGGGVLSISYSSISCAPSDCSGTIKNNGNPETYGCTDVNSDGQNYQISVDKQTMYLTPTLGLDTGCYYKYTRQ